jgi:hypothetical protein
MAHGTELANHKKKKVRNREKFLESVRYNARIIV